MIKKEMASFLGWIFILVGTWLIASTIREIFIEYLVGGGGFFLAIAFGLALIAISVVLFGREKPW